MRNAILCATALIAGVAASSGVYVNATPAPQSRKVTVPAGTRILVRMIDTIDSSKQKAGFRFRASLETNLDTDDRVVAPRGTIVYGLLKAPRDAVVARVSGALVPLRKVVIPARLHPGGVLVYGAFTRLPTELLVRNASGRTVDRKNFGEAAKFETETCEGEAE